MAAESTTPDFQWSERACREVLRERSGGCCERCFGPGPLTLHHRVKRSQGGTWNPSNCIMLCGHGTAGCHGWVEHHPEAGAESGFHVRPWQAPEEVPIVHAGRATWLSVDGAKRMTYVDNTG